MKKTSLLNSELSYEISKLGHTDTLTLCDSGLPIPNEIKRIDLAITKNLPRLLDVFDVIISELQVEEIVFAKEFLDSPLHQELFDKIKLLENTQNKKIVINYVPHIEFKELTKGSKCIVRTGECTPYANLIFKSGVFF